MAKIDIGDTIIEAIQTIIDGNIQKLAFDKTIVATIVDISDANKGRYIVDDGSTEFLAFSDNTEYEENTRVYVNIPNGDFTKQKMITGRYVSANSNEPYRYITPWNKFVDITENLVSLSENSITANDKTREKILGSYEIEDGKSYETLGLKADFRNLLGSLNIASGDYGLKLYITDSNNQTQMIKLSTEDMVGNPYSFETYYNQQKLFDITKSNDIKYITIALYQDNNFSNINGERIPVNPIPNITVDNIYLAFGYNSENFDTDKVLLYTLNKDTYSNTYGEDGKENQKVLKLRWIHRDEDGQYTIYQDSNSYGDNIRVHWYQYELAPNVSDDFAGMFWKENKKWRDTFEQKVNCYEYKNFENIRYKVIIETPVKENLERDARQDPEINATWQKYQQTYIEAETHPNDEEYAEKASEAMREWNIVAAPYTAEQNLYKSDELVFTNEDSVSEAATLDLIQSLSLEVDRNGSFMLYGQNNQLANAGDASKARNITAKYKSFLTGKEDLDQAESISWRFPLVGTMIQAPEDGKEFDSEIDRVEYSSDGQFCTITRDASALTGAIGESFENAATQTFRIKNYYQASASNNVITCYVLKSQKLYQANADLAFGPMGNNGTDYSLIATIADGRNCFYGTDTIPIRIKTNLYDIDENDHSDKLTDSTIYSLYAKDSIRKVSFCDKDGNLILEDNELVDSIESGQECYIRRLISDEIINYNDSVDSITDDIQLIPLFTIIDISCTITDEELKTIKLNTLLPIPFARSKKYTRISGADKIVYNSLGTSPFYYKGSYILYEQGDKEVSFVNWHTENEAKKIEELKFYPSISKDNSLVPLSSYVNNTNTCFAVTARDNNGNVYWSQPISIYQEVYNSTLINGWDGSLSIDEDNGTIMSTMLGAGIKDAENRFSGVLLGDVKGAGADSAASLGLFGYHEGVQSFGFRNDGTAFIGKADKGRIQFDGNKSFIQSQSYTSKAAGMKLDLDDGILEMRGAVLGAIQEGSRNSNVLQSSDFLKLKNHKNDLTNYIFFVDENGKTIPSYYATGQKLYEQVSLILSLILTNNNEEKPANELTDEQKVKIQQALLYIGQNSSRIYFGEVKIQQNANGQYIYNDNIYDTEKDLFEGESLSTKDYFSVYNDNSQKLEQSSYIRLSAISPYFQIKNDEGKFLINIKKNEYYLQSGDYTTKGTDGYGHGTHFNLKDGSLNSYDFTLSAHKSIQYEDKEETTYEEVAVMEMRPMDSGVLKNFKYDEVNNMYYQKTGMTITESEDVPGSTKEYVALIDKENTYGLRDSFLDTTYASYENSTSETSSYNTYSNGVFIKNIDGGKVYGFDLIDGKPEYNELSTVIEYTSIIDNRVNIDNEKFIILGELVEDNIYEDNVLFEGEENSANISYLKIDTDTKRCIYMEQLIPKKFQTQITIFDTKFNNLYNDGQLAEYNLEQNDYVVNQDIAVFFINNFDESDIQIEARQFVKNIIYNSNIIYNELVVLNTAHNKAVFYTNGSYKNNTAEIVYNTISEEKQVRVEELQGGIDQITEINDVTYQRRIAFINVSEEQEDDGTTYAYSTGTKVYLNSDDVENYVIVEDELQPDQFVISSNSNNTFNITEYKNIDTGKTEWIPVTVKTQVLIDSALQKTGIILISSKEEIHPFQIKQESKVTFSIGWDGAISTTKADFGNKVHINNDTLYFGNYWDEKGKNYVYPTSKFYQNQKGVIINSSGIYYKNLFGIGEVGEKKVSLKTNLPTIFNNSVKINNVLGVGGATTLNGGLTVIGTNAYMRGTSMTFYNGKTSTSQWIKINSEGITSNNGNAIISWSKIYDKPTGDAALATHKWVKDQKFVTSLSGYATQTWVKGQKYATQTWVNNKGFIGKGTGPSNGIHYGHTSKVKNGSSATIMYVTRNGYVTSIG